MQKIKKNIVCLMACAFYGVACGGGGGGGGGDRGNQSSGISSSPTQVTFAETSQALSTLSFEELISYFPPGVEMLTKEEGRVFIENYLQKNGKALATKDKETLAEHLFHSEAEAPQLFPALDQVPSSKGRLDKNGDGKITIHDFAFLLNPQFSQDLTESSIEKLYYYWSYFLNVNDPAFKDKMWKPKITPSSSTLAPPVYMMLDRFFKSKRVLLLDFRGKLGLKSITQQNAEQWLKTQAQYQLPFDLTDTFSGPLYQTVLAADGAELIIDKIAMVSSQNSEEEKMYFMIRNNPLAQNALVLTPSLWLHFKTRTQTLGKLHFPRPHLVHSAFAQNDGQLTWDEALEYLRIQMDQESVERQLSTRKSHESFLKDVTASSFIPPSAAEVSPSIQAIQTEGEGIRTEYTRLLTQAKSCEEDRGFKGANLCNLKKMYSILEKLQSRLDWAIQANLSSLKEHLEREYELLRARRQLEEAEGIVQEQFDETMKAAIGLKVLEVVLGGYRLLMKRTVDALKDELFDNAETVLIKSLLEGLAALINQIAKTLHAAEFEDIAALLRLLSEKIAIAVTEITKGGAEVRFKLSLSFGVDSIEALISHYYDKLLEQYRRKWSEIYRLQMEQKMMVDQLKNFDDFLKTTRSKLMEMTLLGHIDVSYQMKIVKRQAQKACEADYQGALQTEVSVLRTNSQALLQELSPFQQKFEAADFEFKMWQTTCKHKKRDIELALVDEADRCQTLSPSFDQRLCETAKQKARFERDFYLDTLKCADKDAPEAKAQKEAFSSLSVKKESVDQGIAQLKLDYAEGLKLAEIAKETCIAKIEPNCDLELHPLQNLSYPENKTTTAWLNVTEIFSHARTILEELKINCDEAASLVRGMFPVDGRLTCSLNQLAKNWVYLWFDHPLAYLSAFGDDIEIEFEVWSGAQKIAFPQDHVRHLEGGGGHVAAFSFESLMSREKKDFQIKVFKNVNPTKTWPPTRREIATKNIEIHPRTNSEGQAACDPASSIGLHVTHQYRTNLRLRELWRGALNPATRKQYEANDPYAIYYAKQEIKFGVTPSSDFYYTVIENVTLIDKTRNVKYPGQQIGGPPYEFRFDAKFEPNTDYEISINNAYVGIQKYTCGSSMKSFSFSVPQCAVQSGRNPYGECTYSMNCFSVSAIPLPWVIPFSTAAAPEFYSDAIGEE
ncbi:MAG: hypothetical protein HY390_06225 [Deltaproteobacteria bacterium]|nr:hypothetical protein [Deltaproteobacteria bacterium]